MPWIMSMLLGVHGGMGPWGEPSWLEAVVLQCRSLEEGSTSCSAGRQVKRRNGLASNTLTSIPPTTTPLQEPPTSTPLQETRRPEHYATATEKNASTRPPRQWQYSSRAVCKSTAACMETQDYEMILRHVTEHTRTCNCVVAYRSHFT